MKIHIDDIIYDANLTKLSDNIVLFYETYKTSLYTIQMDNGKIIDFSPKSITRIALKSLMAPMLLSMLHFIYNKKGVTLPKHERGEDFFDYFVKHSIYILALHDNENIYVTTNKNHNDNQRDIISISTKPKTSLQISYTETNTEEGNKNSINDTRGETLFYPWENGDGENKDYQGDNQKENIRST